MIRNQVQGGLPSSRFFPFVSPKKEIGFYQKLRCKEEWIFKQNREFGPFGKAKVMPTAACRELPYHAGFHNWYQRHFV